MNESIQEIIRLERELKWARFANVILLSILIWLLIAIVCTRTAKADEFEKLQRQVEILEQARADDADQLRDPSYWMMRESIRRNRVDEDESIASRALEMQILADSYPEYFDPNYNYNRRKKYIDMYDY